MLKEYREAMSPETRAHVERLEGEYGTEIFNDRTWYYNLDDEKISVKVELSDVSGNPDLMRAFVVRPVSVGEQTYAGELFEDFTKFTPKPLFEEAKPDNISSCDN